MDIGWVELLQLLNSLEYCLLKRNKKGVYICLDTIILTDCYQLSRCCDVLFVKVTLVDPSHLTAYIISNKLKQAILGLYSILNPIQSISIRLQPLLDDAGKCLSCLTAVLCSPCMIGSAAIMVQHST